MSESKGMDLSATSFGPARAQYRGEEGLVMLGCSGKIDEWKQQLTDDLVEEKVGKGKYKDFFKKDVLLLETTKGRHDLVFFFKKNTKLDIGKMAAWRLGWGNQASWWSDYIVNYANQHLATA